MKYDFGEVIERKNTNSFKYDYASEYFGTDRLLPMWVADMDFRTPDFILEAIRERTMHEVLGYSIRPDSLFSTLVEWYKVRQGWPIRKEWILFSPGVVSALSLAVRAFTEEGQGVVVQPPVYHPFFSVIRDNKRRIIYNPLREEKGRYTMDFENLEKNLGSDVRLLLLSHPHNPVGRVWTLDELEHLASICDRHNILVVSDEIHSDLVFSPHRHIPFSMISDAAARTSITCVAASKTFNLAGLSSSAVIIQDEGLRAKFNHELSTGHLHMGNIFGNIAMEAAYSKGLSWLEQLIHYLKGNLDLLEEFVREELPGITLSPCEATYLAWLDMKGLGLNPKALRRFMIEEARIGCNDGPSFGPGGEGFQRLNFACPRSVLEKALQQLRHALEKRN
jgi:cystathionine beta-lyase